MSYPGEERESYQISESEYHEACETLEESKKLEQQAGIILSDLILSFAKRNGIAGVTVDHVAREVADIVTDAIWKRLAGARQTIEEYELHRGLQNSSQLRRELGTY